MAADPRQGAVCPQLDREFYLEEVRAATGLSVVAANARIELALDLVRRLPATLAALETGVITLAHARHLSDAVDGVEDRAAHEVEQAALDYAATRRDLASFRRKVRREMLLADRRDVEQRLAAAIAERRVWRTDEDDAMSVVGALLPAPPRPRGDGRTRPAGRPIRTRRPPHP